MRVTYGIEPLEVSDQYFQMVEEISGVGEAIAIPGRFPVEAAPSLLYLPSWCPGAGFKQYAADGKTFLHETLGKLYKGAVDGLVSILTYTWCMHAV